MDDPIKVAIADDHPFFREGLAHVLRRSEGITLVGVASTAPEALDIVAAADPDVLLLDIGMPGGGLEALRAMRANGTRTRIVMLTGSDDDVDVATALGDGASGYLLKGVEAGELLEAIRSVHRGQPYVTSVLSCRMLVDTYRPRPVPSALEQRLAKLNDRERRMLELAAQGKSNLDIATMLEISLPAVKNSMSRLFDKLEVKNRAEAIAVCASSRGFQSATDTRRRDSGR